MIPGVACTKILSGCALYTGAHCARENMVGTIILILHVERHKIALSASQSDQVEPQRFRAQPSSVSFAVVSRAPSTDRHERGSPDGGALGTETPDSLPLWSLASLFPGPGIEQAHSVVTG